MSFVRRHISTFKLCCSVLVIELVVGFTRECLRKNSPITREIAVTNSCSFLLRNRSCSVIKRPKRCLDMVRINLSVSFTAVTAVGFRYSMYCETVTHEMGGTRLFLKQSRRDNAHTPHAIVSTEINTSFLNNQSKSSGGFTSGRLSILSKSSSS